MKIDINDLTLGQLKEIQALSKSSQSEKSAFIGKVVLVRTYSAGVHMGTLENKNGTNVLLKNSHRIWKWGGAFTLSEVATIGINEESRVSCEVPIIELTQSIELIPMSDQAISRVKENVE